MTDLSFEKGLKMKGSRTVSTSALPRIAKSQVYVRSALQKYPVQRPGRLERGNRPSIQHDSHEHLVAKLPRRHVSCCLVAALALRRISVVSVE